VYIGTKSVWCIWGICVYMGYVCCIRCVYSVYEVCVVYIGCVLCIWGICGIYRVCVRMCPRGLASSLATVMEEE
jgi:hypothetical protein